MDGLLNSSQIRKLIGIKSDTTLIKYEKEGIIKVTRRFGNQKRSSAKQIQALFNY